MKKVHLSITVFFHKTTVIFFDTTMILSCTTKEGDKRYTFFFFFCVAILPFHNENEKDLPYILGIKIFINSPFDIIII